MDTVILSHDLQLYSRTRCGGKTQSEQHTIFPNCLTINPTFCVVSNSYQMSLFPSYQPIAWVLGGQPQANIDIPITAVFLGLYTLGAVLHMLIFQNNNKRGHKFIFSVLIFGMLVAVPCQS